MEVWHIGAEGSRKEPCIVQPFSKNAVQFQICLKRFEHLTCHSMYCVQAAAPVLWILTQKVQLLVFHITAHRFAIRTIINKLIIFNWCDTFCNHIRRNTSKFNSMCLLVPTGGIGSAIQAQMTPFTHMQTRCSAEPDSAYYAVHIR